MTRTGRVALAAALALVGCKKKEEAPEDVPVPPRNAATLDVVNTEIGSGFAVRGASAPTSIRWERVTVLDEDRAVLFGRENDEAWALRTNDRGRTWFSVTATVRSWAEWGLGANGSLALVSGTSDRAKGSVAATGREGVAKLAAPIVEATVWHAAATDKALDGPRPFLPGEGALAGASVVNFTAVPALFDSGIAVLGEKNRVPTMLFAPVAGTAKFEPLVLDKQSFVAVPYGRPARLLSVSKGAIEVRAWPGPGDALGVASPVPNVRTDATTFAQLSEGPHCEAGAFSFRRVSGPQSFLLGISGDRALSFKLPGPDASRVGCSKEGVVVETVTVDPSDAEKRRKVPQLVRCGLDGKCAEPKAPPFAIWNDKHERKIWSVPTKRGLVAVMHATTGTRWGVYLAQSNDGGASFELPRTVGEGAESNHSLEVSALLRFQERIVLLLTADVGTTGRRGYYALASDDEGNNWGPP